MALIHRFKQGDNYFVLDVNTGAVHIVDELVFDLLDDNNLRDKEQLLNEFADKYGEDLVSEAYDEIKELKEEGYLYSEDLYEDIAHKSVENKDYIKAVCLNIIHACNLRCKYCFADEGEYHGNKGIMSPEVAKKALDFVIKNSGSRKNIEVDFFGGEPLMAMETIKETILYGREIEKKYNKNIRFTMTTNATLLDEETMKFLDKEMGNIILSIDGRKDINDKVRVRVDGGGSYEKIFPTIKDMIKNRNENKQYYARGTFTRNNPDFYEDIMHLVKEGMDEISMEPVVLPDAHELSIREEDLPKIFESYDKLYEEMDKRNKDNKGKFKFYHFNINLQGGPCVYKRIAGCGAGYEYVAITPQGDIYPCHQFVGKEEFKLGHLDSEEYNYELGKNFKAAHIYNKPVCRGCWARFYCSGGCQANNYNFNNDIKTPYEIGCKMQKKRIECAIALKALENERNEK